MDVGGRASRTFYNRTLRHHAPSPVQQSRPKPQLSPENPFASPLATEPEPSRRGRKVVSPAACGRTKNGARDRTTPAAESPSPR